VDVEVHELFAQRGVAAEIGRVGDAGQLAREIGGVAGAVIGVVEQGVGVVEDVPRGDGWVAVVITKFFERPICDVFAAAGAVFCVDIERKELRWSSAKVM
jgi:ABC-type uncharacterized transport system permease subunit